MKTISVTSYKSKWQLTRLMAATRQHRNARLIAVFVVRLDCCCFRRWLTFMTSFVIRHGGDAAQHSAKSALSRVVAAVGRTVRSLATTL
jgi:hypothetical protein